MWRLLWGLFRRDRRRWRLIKNIILGEIENVLDIEIAREVLNRRKDVIRKCVDIINEQLIILDGFGIKVYDEDKSYLLHEIKNVDDIECEMDLEYL